MNIEEAKKLDMVDYLSSLGFQAQKTTGDQSWYHSPLHADKTPSFKVNRKLNKWYDFADGKGGNLIDFGIAFFNCSVKEFLSKLDLDHGTIQTMQHDPNQYNQHTGDAIQITRVQPIFSLPLQRYLRERRIPQHLADQYLKEVHYSLKGKNYYALGFRNDAGGYELRNQYIKGSTSPKSPTTYATDANTWCKTPTMGMPTSSLSVFEGFMDFLSYLTLRMFSRPDMNYLILNSLSFFDKELPRMQQYGRVHLFLDNDQAANKITANALSVDPQKFQDERKLYQNYKDLNEWCQQQGKTNRQQQKP